MDANGFFNGLGSAIVIAYLGYLTGYLLGWIALMSSPVRDMEIPLRWAEHGAAVVGFIAVATAGLLSLR